MTAVPARLSTPKRCPPLVAHGRVHTNRVGHDRDATTRRAEQFSTRAIAFPGPAFFFRAKAAVTAPSVLSIGSPSWRPRSALTVTPALS